MGKLARTLQFTAITLFVSVGLVFVVLSLPFSGWKALSVQTGSMKPAIPPGALVLVHRISPNTIKRGDVITYRSKQNPKVTITHRVVERTVQHNGVALTKVKGDANKLPDQPVLDSQIVGAVVGSAPHLGKALDFVKKPLGLALLIYLPAVLIFVSEIQLLVKRLTKLELDKQRTQLQPAMAGASPDGSAQVEVTEPIAPDTPKPAHKSSNSRIIGRMGVILIPVLAIGLIAPTLSQMETEATISGNTISTTKPTTPPPDQTRVIIDRVDFPCQPEPQQQTATDDKVEKKDHKNHHDECDPDPVAITLYSNKRVKKLDLTNWTLSNSNGVLYTFTKKSKRHGDSHQLRVVLDESQSLNISGDFVALKDANGVIVDGLSWGSNTSQLNPSIQGIQPNDDIKRKHHRDTDSATDWFIVP